MYLAPATVITRLPLLAGEAPQALVVGIQGIRRETELHCGQVIFHPASGYSAAYERYGRNSVMRCAEGAACHEHGASGKFPATECIFVVSNASPRLNGGSIDGRRFAIIDFPARAYQKNVMAAGTCHFESSFHGFRPFTSEKSKSKEAASATEYFACVNFHRL